jgi:transcription elongation factor SPT6
MRIVDHDQDYFDPYVLDNTRIHPEHYNMAQFIAANALDLVDDLDDGYVDVCAEVMEPGNCLKLNDLDLDAYCTMLEEEGRVGLRETLYDIKDELQFPFREVCVECREAASRPP